MISWLIIVVLIIIGALILKASHIRHRFSFILIILLFIFLFYTMDMVTKKNNLDIKTTEGFFNAVKIYVSWLGLGFHNMKVLVGNAIKMDWTSINGTFIGQNKSIIFGK
jgi:hypothetical protein